MSASSGIPDAAVDRRSWLRAVADYLRTPEGHATILGFVGAVMITFGGFGAGSVRRHDPLLEEMRLSWLRFGHGYALSTLIIWGGVLSMIIAWVRLGRSTINGRVGLRALMWTVPAWTAPMLLAVPMFSRDAYSYLAQGALLRDGFDPYAVGPVVNPGILLDNVSNVWTTTTAPYGPISLLIGQGITAVTGDNVVAGTMLLRVAFLPGLAMMMWALPRLALQLGGRPTIAVWLAVLNPLVLIHLIGGVHNELLMVGLMVAGITLALDRKHVAAIALIALGVAVKAMAGIALPFIVWIWMIHERDRALAEGREPATPVALFVRTAGIGVAVFAAIFTAASAIAGVGLGWLTALSGSAKIINWLSLPTIMAHVVTIGTGWFTGLTSVDSGSPVLGVTRSICFVALAVVLVWVWWRFRKTERDAVMGILVALVAIVILSPAALPWYYSWPLAIAAGFSMSTRMLQILVGLSTWLMLVFQPDGSIGLYTFFHVALATFVAVVAAVSLRTVDPLRLRSVSEKVPDATAHVVDQLAPAAPERRSSPL
ncbi:alpha-(1-_6)-mannopyranosyltransferase A [Prescottella agglutinans]|uniref:Alpha-(1->6)-mannopyranosyltransferase A n=1 Tax=Prescottella agglutinans TaxID=1644129 RepID=A0A438BDJ9_9NOCA|nr:alpha-(1->6)-mannopyranosyltransferase A [Prescottella agglutinans]RVW08981.1 alpha-(1->6)-mannopyranosyltransferase A [Prescottella agglutinans]